MHVIFIIPVRWVSRETLMVASLNIFLLIWCYFDGKLCCFIIFLNNTPEIPSCTKPVGHMYYKYIYEIFLIGIIIRKVKGFDW